ncbi:hypothetical protein DFH27DRAFT_638927 [Peziza echinospora]|nr:hypothetical protein DFH27DRAFT_638927 [Peziza echinospora]
MASQPSHMHSAASRVSSSLDVPSNLDVPASHTPSSHVPSPRIPSLRVPSWASAGASSSRIPSWATAGASSSRARSTSPPLLHTPGPARERSHSPPGGDEDLVIRRTRGQNASQPAEPRSTSATIAFKNLTLISPSSSYPANLAVARGRIVSGSSISSVFDAHELSYSLTAPAHGVSYPVGLSPLESCLACYPVFESILDELSTIDILKLRDVSKTCRVHIRTAYKLHLSRIDLVKDRNWLSKGFQPYTVNLKLVMDWRFVLLKYFIGCFRYETQLILRNGRDQYDGDVYYLIRHELGIPINNHFISGGTEKPYCCELDMDQLPTIQEIVNDAYTAPKKELKRVMKKYLYTKLDEEMFGNIVTRVTKLNTNLKQNLKFLCLDGTDVDTESLDLWTLWLAELVVKKEKFALKWLKVCGSGGYENNPIQFDTEEDPEIPDTVPPHVQYSPLFQNALSIDDHLKITVPMMISFCNRTEYNKSAEDRFAAFQEICGLIERHHERQVQRHGNWVHGPFLDDLPMSMQLMALCESLHVDLDFTFCAMGSKCHKFSLTRKPSGFTGPTGPDTMSAPFTHARLEMSTHTLADHQRDIKGGQKCDSCGCWEWEGLGARNLQKYLFDNLYLDEGYIEEGGVWVSYNIKDNRKVSYRLVVGKDLHNASGMDRFPEEFKAQFDTAGAPPPSFQEHTIHWPLGMGIGRVCDDCTINMTCWGCGKFYCQLCLYSVLPAPSLIPPEGARLRVRSKTQDYLKYLCAKGRHGPFCLECVDRYTTKCEGCHGHFCDICHHGGVDLESTSRDEYKRDQGTSVDIDPESAWDDFYELDYDLSDSSSDGESDDLTTEGERSSGGENGRLGSTIVAVVNNSISKSSIAEAMALDIPLEALHRPLEIQSQRSVPRVIDYNAPPFDHNFYQRKLVDRFQKLPAYLHYQGFQAPNVYIRCEICSRAFCMVCTKGCTTGKTPGTWSLCSGCSQNMCDTCTHSQCVTCKRALCKRCHVKENDQAVVRIIEGLHAKFGFRLSNTCPRCVVLVYVKSMRGWNHLKIPMMNMAGGGDNDLSSDMHRGRSSIPNQVFMPTYFPQGMQIQSSPNYNYNVHGGCLTHPNIYAPSMGTTSLALATNTASSNANAPDTQELMHTSLPGNGTPRDISALQTLYNDFNGALGSITGLRQQLGPFFPSSEFPGTQSTSTSHPSAQQLGPSMASLQPTSVPVQHPRPSTSSGNHYIHANMDQLSGISQLGSSASPFGNPMTGLSSYVVTPYSPVPQEFYQSQMDMRSLQDFPSRLGFGFGDTYSQLNSHYPAHMAASSSQGPIQQGPTALYHDNDPNRGRIYGQQSPDYQHNQSGQFQEFYNSR